MVNFNRTLKLRRREVREYFLKWEKQREKINKMYPDEITIEREAEYLTIFKSKFN
jgi:hypothetical protein